MTASTRALPAKPEKKPRRTRGPRRERSMADLMVAPMLRPHEVHRLYGIVENTLHGYIHRLPEGERLPHIHVRGVKGRRGCTWVRHDVLKGWLRWHELREAGNAGVIKHKTFGAWWEAIGKSDAGSREQGAGSKVA